MRSLKWVFPFASVTGCVVLLLAGRWLPHPAVTEKILLETYHSVHTRLPEVARNVQPGATGLLERLLRINPRAVSHTVDNHAGLVQIAGQLHQLLDDKGRKRDLPYLTALGLIDRHQPIVELACSRTTKRKSTRVAQQQALSTKLEATPLCGKP